MSSRPINKPEEMVSVGDELWLTVIRVDTNERRIGLSLKEIGADVERADVKEYQARQRKRHRDDGEDEEE